MDNAGIQLETHNISRSFIWHSKNIDDTSLLYTIQYNPQMFFFTNDKLYTIGIKRSPLCNFCKISEGNIEHMLLSCPVIKSFWDSV